jgi:hypothetical protein
VRKRGAGAGIRSSFPAPVTCPRYLPLLPAPAPVLCLLWPYFFQGGSVLRAGFSFLSPRAQSACMSV